MKEPLVSAFVATTIVRKRFQLVQQLSVVVEQLQIMHDGSLRGRLKRLLTVCQAEVSTSTQQQDHSQRHGGYGPGVQRRTIGQTRAQPLPPSGRRGLALFLKPSAQAGQKIGAR